MVRKLSTRKSHSFNTQHRAALTIGSRKTKGITFQMDRSAGHVIVWHGMEAVDNISRRPSAGVSFQLVSQLPKRFVMLSQLLCLRLIGQR